MLGMFCLSFVFLSFAVVFAVVFVFVFGVSGVKNNVALLRNAMQSA